MKQSSTTIEQLQEEGTDLLGVVEMQRSNGSSLYLSRPGARIWKLRGLYYWVEDGSAVELFSLSRNSTK